jgi:hypothetical protein
LCSHPLPSERTLPGPLGDLLVAFAALLAVTLGGSQGRKERQGPCPTGPRDLRQQRQAHPSEGARFDEVGAAGTCGVAVDPLGRDLLPLAPLERLIYAHDQWFPFGYEGFHQRIQKDAARLPARPDSMAQHSVVAMEGLLLVQAHRSQGRTHRPIARSEDRTREQHLDMLEDALGEKWRERGQNPYHHGR